MRKADRESLARAKRVARLAQRAIDVLGGAGAAYHWLTMPCAALGGTAPYDIHYDADGARRVATALRLRAARERLVRKMGDGTFPDVDALTEWLWKKNRTLRGRRPAMLLDTDRGAREVLAVLSRLRRRTR